MTDFVKRELVLLVAPELLSVCAGLSLLRGYDEGKNGESKHPFVQHVTKLLQGGESFDFETICRRLPHIRTEVVAYILGNLYAKREIKVTSEEPYFWSSTRVRV